MSPKLLKLYHSVRDNHNYSKSRLVSNVKICTVSDGVQAKPSETLPTGLVQNGPN